MSDTRFSFETSPPSLAAGVDRALEFVEPGLWKARLVNGNGEAHENLRFVEARARARLRLAVEEAFGLPAVALRDAFMTEEVATALARQVGDAVASRFIDGIAAL